MSATTTATVMCRAPALHALDMSTLKNSRDETAGLVSRASRGTAEQDPGSGPPCFPVHQDAAAVTTATTSQEYPQPTKKYGEQWEWDPETRDYVRFDRDGRKLLYRDYQKAIRSPGTPSSDASTVIPSTRSSSEVTASGCAPRADPCLSAEKPSWEQPLGDAFQVVAKPKRFFCVGRIFKAVWFEPGDSAAAARRPPGTETWVSRCPAFYGEKPTARFRWFVVVRRRPNHSLCFSITTYGGRGGGGGGGGGGRRPGADCVVLHNANVEPPMPYDDEGIVRDPIAVIIEDEGQFMAPRARLDCGRIYTVEDSLRIMKIGRVHPASLPLLDQYYKDCFS